MRRLVTRIGKSDPYALILSFFLGASFMQGISILRSQGATARSRPLEDMPSQAPDVTSPVRDANSSSAVASANPSSAQRTAVRTWLQAQFDMMDKDRDGRLDKQDVAHVSETMHLPLGQVQKLRSIVGDRELAFDELAEVRGWLQVQFQIMDHDQDGSFDHEDLARVGRKMHLSPSFAKMFESKVGDQELNMNAFRAIVHQMELLADNSKSGPSTLLSDSSGSVLSESITRASLLLGLMILQSGSAVVLGRYENLLKDHYIVMLFLTMLVGAGGNVGNQSVIKVIELLVSGKLQVNATTSWQIILHQLAVGSMLAFILGLGGFIRAFVSQYWMRFSDLRSEDGRRALQGCVAVTIALMVIVVTSAVLGTCMPLALAVLHLDVVHAGPSIQVVMDIGGVIITCAIARAILVDTGHGGDFKAP